jgi:hypothetical protein
LFILIKFLDFFNCVNKYNKIINLNDFFQTGVNPRQHGNGGTAGEISRLVSICESRTAQGVSAC